MSNNSCLILLLFIFQSSVVSKQPRSNGKVFDSNIKYESENLSTEEHLPLTEKSSAASSEFKKNPVASVAALSGSKCAKKLYFHHKNAATKKDLKMVVKGGLTLLEEAATSTGSIDSTPQNCSHVWRLRPNFRLDFNLSFVRWRCQIIFTSFIP